MHKLYDLNNIHQNQKETWNILALFGIEVYIVILDKMFSRIKFKSFKIQSALIRRGDRV